MQLAIYGPGGYGREVASFFRRQGEVVFVSDSGDEIGTLVNDILVISFDELVRRGWPVCIAVADATTRRILAEKCDRSGVPHRSAIASTCVIGDAVQLIEGAILSDFAMVTASASIGRCFHANIYSYVAHDCVVGDYVTLAPRVCVNGNTIIEDDVYIGTGAVLKQGTSSKPLRIGKGAIIGMGAVVTKDVAAGVTVVGNPARPLER